MRDREIRRLGAEVCKGGGVDARALQFRAEAHEGIIVQLSEQVARPCPQHLHLPPSVRAACAAGRLEWIWH